MRMIKMKAISRGERRLQISSLGDARYLKARARKKARRMMRASKKVMCHHPKK